MKDILALTRAITDTEYYSDMFDGWGEEKNILFVSPQLSGRHLYKTILPFLCLRSEKVATAVSSLKRYDYKRQLLDFQIDLSDEMVDWADIIVFPFTTQPLVEEIYTRIRELKPEVKIFFSVDFNFYELSQHHPFKEIFSDELVIDDVESNMYFADMVVVTNIYLMNYIVKKVQGLQETKFKSINGYMGITSLPLFIDSDIMLKNVDYDAKNINKVIVVKRQESSPAPKVEEPIVQEPKKVEAVENSELKKLIEKTELAAEKVKAADEKIKEEAAKEKEENFKKHEEYKAAKKEKVQKLGEPIKPKKKDKKIKAAKAKTANGKQPSSTTVKKSNARGKSKSTSKRKGKRKDRRAKK